VVAIKETIHLMQEIDEIIKEYGGGWIHIHMTGDNINFKHVTVVNNPNSKTRYNRVLFRDLRKLLLAQNKWPFDAEGSETD